MRFQAVLPTLAFFGTFAPTQVSATNSKESLALASALGVSVSTLNQMYTANVTADLDVGIWTHVPGAGDSDDYLDWTDDIKLEFLLEIKSIVSEFFDPTPKATSDGNIAKREIGSDSSAARAQVQSVVAKAKASRDSSNRRVLLQCNSGTQRQCTVCAGICSVAWTSAVALCSGAALGAEVGSGGFLTPAVALTLTGCIGASTAGYAACIVKCVG
ncbi:hypothetical protein DDE82_004408 [Stemphylium lycopersici]|uniref:Uncharacterized protein n=1 Tax=Stemphylium lycopersici TaxID=183478 RepID=A0A364MSI4_STELY|nr:hypothetical protein TW65_05720 [Stemphylium lycopersici]RAR01988.1 hypothetical protein DDE83_008726 [Stemphylium lycopersici]RAR04694.1 hypothetical protein DDE82_004408 [Stemphylium lycopersici]